MIAHRKLEVGDTGPDSSSDIAAQLVSGGDDRIATGENGRNEYGTPPLPAGEDVWFSSSTASAISPRGYAAVDTLTRTLGQGGSWPDGGIAALCISVRSRLNALFGIEGSAAILSASGTDAELLMLGIAERCGGAPVTTIVIAPKESGSGVVLACGGQHFRERTCLGAEVDKGARVAGWEGADLSTETVDLRLPDGSVRSAATVDAEVEVYVNAALAAGRDVVLHVLDTSKTGLQTCTRDTAARLMRGAPGRVHVVVDSCQLRCSAARVQADLDRGFAVIVTGSKFAGGPPFSGALLLPPALAERFAGAAPLPAGFRDYSASHDWPASLRATALDEPSRHNTGAALRWVAALTEFEAAYALGADVTDAIVAHFDAEICERAARCDFMRPLFAATDPVSRTRSIVPLVALGTNCAPLSMAQTKELHRALRTPIGEGACPTMGRSVNIGQPVDVGECAVLRLCIDAPRLVDIAAHLAEGRTMREAFAGTVAELDVLFEKWAMLIDGKVFGPERRRSRVNRG